MSKQTASRLSGTISTFTSCKLHINDGWMGGGTEILHENNFRSNWSYYYENYFTNSRHGIFHYCVMAPRNNMGSDSVLGEGETRGDMFVLYDDNLGGTWPWTDRTTMQAHLFMHELGHNLMGVYYPNSTDATNNFDHNPKAAHLINVDPPNDDNEHCGHTCALQTKLYPWDTHAIDYCSDCWNAINLAWCF